MTIHIPVLMDEVLEGLQPEGSKVIVDGTLGGGGHTAAILKLLGPEGRVISFDRDLNAVEEAAAKIDDPRFTPIHGNYADFPEHLKAMGIEAVDGVLLDLGYSSDQLADEDRGFSFNNDGELDLRFDRLDGEPAWRLVNRLSEKHLADLIYNYGEERLSRRIARKICAVREADPIKTSQQLARVVRSCVPRSKNHSIDPATRTFQAIRIAVNDELKFLQETMKRLPQFLKLDGRAAIISFHSLEDRIVKRAINGSDEMEPINRKPITASDAELDANSRSRSAKLRVAKRIQAIPMR
ncbi:16S rRNA (cytosine(1402)-N(4))-methyltransferase RsmH [Mariniblastus fucicola]|uniref:Ribosomal RNA small subunit methyltransferase H n=1 Tax=Mariniblastus fucicola TaxID=980251 RepID=A0A5B9P8W8_9BACT|nr:16S rRNA (cytosine(1402)-N(4))-methyltransferase RsmH [Mariniblastus fucicola]QEG21330.1 Ribosomal RNA small subunit methyltransferase H [Mariniblastus fucicola]